MKDKINKILELIKHNKFNDAKSICDSIKNNLEQNFEFINIHGYVLFRLGNYEEAIKLWKKVINIKPDYAFAFNNLGNVYSKLNNLEESLKYFTEALKLKPDYFEASYGISNVYLKKNNYHDALFYLNKSLKVKPNISTLIKIKLELLRVMDKKKEALSFLDEMIYYNPNDAYLYNEKALILSQLNREIEAINSYKTAYIINPDYPFVLGNIVFDKLKNCEWDNIENNFDDIYKKIKKGKEVSDPLLVSYIFDSPLIQNETAKIMVNFKKDKKYHEYQFSNLENHKKLNIGYFSADFRNHPVGHLISRSIELHDKSRYNVHGFYFGKRHKEDDPYYLRLKKAFFKFHEVADKSSKEIVNLSRELKIDIAIDLMGHTGGFENRIEIFVNKCAPIQINFLGYPGTSGTNKIEYILADKTVIQEDEKKFYTEKIIYLPNSYQPSEKNRHITNKTFKKKQFNLPEDKFIFCCFNSNQKILKTTCNLWVEILRKVPKSVLWLLSKNNKFILNFRKEFEKNNIEPDRIIFSHPISVDEHLARIKLADLFLDTFPYNAHTTCNDSIWAGVPVLTKMGKSFHSRVASSLLKTSSLEELITHSDKEYIDKAIKIASDANYLKNLKEKLRTSKDKNPLFDSELFTKNLEKAYEIIYNRYLNKENPEDIYL